MDVGQVEMTIPIVNIRLIETFVIPVIKEHHDITFVNINAFNILQATDMPTLSGTTS